MGEAASTGEQSAMGVEVEMNNDEERRSSCKEGSNSVVRWERFLPKMVVRVLLIEADDSTRQLISALLRKCNYKVAAVADGLRAWEVLRERSRDIDLILTEVDLPSISGFALLSLITEDEICKNIPVIMMSSHDSIGTVHKCMMRGASDFLMKPIRINELKNLWQHVWRKQSCHLAMGFGLSLQVESVAEMKVDEATAENNASSDHSCGSKALPPREECFRKGSDAQSSCTNPSWEARSAYAEEDSQGLSKIKKLKPSVYDAEVPQDGGGMTLATRANIVTDGNLCKGIDTVSQGRQLGHNVLVSGNDLGSEASGRITMRVESPREAIDLIGAFDSNKGSYGGSCLNNEPKISESSELNLSWSGLQLNGFESNTNRNNVLIQSNASAFSRYKQSQVIPRESTTNSVEHHNTSVISLPMQHREKPEALPYEQHRPYPIPIAARHVSSSLHFPGDRPIFHEQHFICIDERRKHEQKVESMDKKTSFSPATNQSGSESFCKGPVSHTNWPVMVTNGNTNPNLPPAICDSDNGNLDERFIAQDKNLQHCTQREAALMKFRLKRKDRCYEKKVRYESRKKLADQRPRVKGQFVRRIPPDPPPTIQ